MSIATIVRLSEHTARPAFLPLAKTWLMSVDGVSYMTAPGNGCGVMGDWTMCSLAGGTVDPGMMDDVLGEGFTAMVGGALMDSKVLWIVDASKEDLVTVSTYGLMSGRKPPVTLRCEHGPDSNVWTRVRLEPKPQVTKAAPHVQLKFNLVEK